MTSIAENPLITIFTPLYNRAHFLERIFESLNKQTVQNFEWLVVDDGSTDGAENVLKSIENKDKKFDFSYYRQENGGKHRAINFAVKKAKGEYMFILDSDDVLVPEAMEFSEKWINEIKALPDYEKFVGVSGFKITPQGKLLSGRGPDTEFVDATSIDRGKYNIVGDCAEVWKLEVLKKYPFPEFPGEKFLSEGAVWNPIALDGYKLRWYKIPIYVAEYLPDGLTKNIDAHEKSSFEGYTYCIVQMLKFVPFKTKVYILGKYQKIASEKEIKFFEQTQKLNVNFIFYFLSGVVFKLYNVLKSKLNKKREYEGGGYRCIVFSRYISRASYYLSRSSLLEAA